MYGVKTGDDVATKKQGKSTHLAECRAHDNQPQVNINFSFQEKQWWLSFCQHLFDDVLLNISKVEWCVSSLEWETSFSRKHLCPEEVPQKKHCSPSRKEIQFYLLAVFYKTSSKRWWPKENGWFSSWDEITNLDWWGRLSWVLKGRVTWGPVCADVAHIRL